MTVLQRRPASAPEAIYQSLRRRRERLECGELLEIQSKVAEIQAAVPVQMTLIDLGLFLKDS